MNQIFNKQLPEVKKNDELQQLISEYPELDPGFINTSTSIMLVRKKRLIEEMWLESKKYLDPDFDRLLRMKGNFLSRCWEMTVATSLLRLGYFLQEKKTDQGPDVKLKLKSDSIWVEAISCTSGVGNDSVPPLLYGVAQTLPMEEMVLRVGNAVIVKFRKYIDYLKSGVIDGKDPFIIAISKGSIGHPDPYPPAIVRYLYGIGDLALHIPLDKKTGERKVTKTFFTRQLPIPKKQGEKVPVAFFEDVANAGVSAIVYCDNNILNHPEPLGSDFVLLKNPNAINPLPDDFLSIGAEWIAKNGLVTYMEKNYVKQSDAFDYLNENN